MTDSEGIERIERLLVALGARVHHHVFELPCIGMYRSETREVFLNAWGARTALLAIAHEAGHHIGYRRCPMRRSEDRELQAHVYGFEVLQIIGADVSLDEWRAAETEGAAAPDVDTSHVRSRD